MAEEGREIDGVFAMISGAQGADEHAVEAIERAKNIPIWSGAVEPELLSGGLSNINLTVEDGGEKFVVKVGKDEPHIGAIRANELLAMRATAKVGISPEVIYGEPGLVVIRFIEGKSLTPADVREVRYLEGVAQSLKRLHREAHKHLDGPGFIFWPFHHIRWYIRQLYDKKDTLDKRWLDRLPGYLEINDEAEEVTGAVNIVFAHNDVLPQNYIDDGKRLWLVDWEYAGYDSELFDLAGIGMNTEITLDKATRFLEFYYETRPSDDLLRRYWAMMLATCLRETTWSFLAEVTPRPVAFDYSVYSTMNVERLDRIYAVYKTF
ncbi:MAG: phosphotransferase [Proteobacteria bacterium]|nr:phosphotransferase [Pseudomonadota bacterium]